ncbi:cyclin-T1-3-like isoform X2 [Prunus yedoensis var. nudiflora]|uniref:B-like cyclin n=1 Tax=Prunus yedoensis var. nudiflora TaxID=2094558 RepID=A0A314Z6T1_PRUYE|nr:cyclin-T1-3-like isoform X2 [Prunus yedoensis var. nudiflora]
MSDVGSYKDGQDRPEEGACWYFYRKEIEENSPSRRDGIDLKKETYLRKSYCTYLQDLGMRLKVPQLTIATSIIFCHRFFLRQSHAKNDRRTIATVCMFLAGKVEETPRPLKDVILVSYEIIHKKDPKAVQRIKQKEVYEQQKELILLGERVVLGTLGFDLNVLHPYKPLVEAIKKFQVAQNALAQVAWNFVNDGLRTSLCLQFKPHHIAAGAIFLAAKFLKVKLPSDGERVWWQEFDVTPRQLEEVSNQMLELYEQNRVPASNEVEGTAASGAAHRAPAKATTSNEEYAKSNSNLQGGDTRPGTLKLASSRPEPEQLDVGNDNGPPRNTQSLNNDNRSTDIRNAPDHDVNVEFKDNQHSAPLSSHQEQMGDAQNVSKSGSEGRHEEGQEDNGQFDTREAGELKAKQFGRSLENGQGALGQSPQDVIKKIDKNKVKAALEKRRKSQGDVTRKKDLMDEDDLIEMELEDGIELAAGSEKIKGDGSQSWVKSSNRSENEDLHQGKQEEDARNGRTDLSNVEEGEVSALADGGQGYHSPISSDRKRKSPPLNGVEKKQRCDYSPGTAHHNQFDHAEDHSEVGRVVHTEMDHKRQVQENHV